MLASVLVGLALTLVPAEFSSAGADRPRAELGEPVPIATEPDTPRPSLVVQPEIAAQTLAPVAVPPADRWLLMKSLQGTWPGWSLERQRIQVSGWTDASFTASSARVSNLPMGFNFRANDFLLQQNWLRVERPVVTSGTTEPTLGFRCDTILPGADYRFTLARGLFNGQLTASNGQPNLYGIDPIQFYAEAYIPTVLQGMDVKVGHFFAQFGVESNDAPGNALFSHGNTFIYDPFTHTGILTTTKLTNAWSCQLGIVTGSDIFIDRAAQPTGLGSIKWAPPTGRDSVLFSVIVGPGRFDQARSFHNPEVFDLVYTHKINARLNYTVDGLFGCTSNVPELGAARWFGIVNYLTCDFTPRLSGTTRLEFFDDVQGQRTGFAGLYTALTAGLSFKPRKGIIFRPEVRYDYNDESRPYENKHGLFTAAADLIVRW